MSNSKNSKNYQPKPQKPHRGNTGSPSIGRPPTIRKGVANLVEE